MALKRIFNWARRSSLSDATVIATDDESSGSRGITFADLKAIFQVRSEKAANNGYAPLDANGLIPAANLRPALTPEIAADNTALAALTVVSGDIGKRLVHVTATGITWLAMTAGSGSDKWMPYSSEPAASTSAPGIVQLAASSDAETNELKALTLAEFLRRLGPYRNALAPAQALSFNGTADASVAAIPAFGTGDFSVAILVNPAALTTNHGLIGGLLNSFGLYATATGAVGVWKTNVAIVGTSAAGTLTVNTPTLLTYTRSGTSGVLYANGISVLAVTDSQDYSVATTTLNSATAVVRFTGTLRLIGIANRALSPAEVLSLYQTGSWPAADFGQGVNDSGTTVYAGAQMINGANSTFASDSGWWAMIGGTNIAAGVANFVANSTISRNSILTVGKRYRATFTLTASGGTFKVQDGATFFLTGLTTGTQSFEFVAGGNTFGISSVGATGTVDNLTITPLGLLVAPDPMQLGSGPQWRDMSGNNAHINLPGDGVDMGVAWTNRSPEGWFTYTRTSSGYLFGGWAIIPSGYYIAEMWISGNGAAAITVGESAGTWTNVVASYVPAATPAPATLLVRTTSNRMLYLYLSASITCTVTVRIAKIG